jgi:hypothetical protein
MNSTARLWRLATSDDAEHEQLGRASTPIPRREDELLYRVEIWNYTGAFVDQTLAITISKNVGFAAYYAAIENFSDSLITLRQKGVVLARSHARKH